MKKSLRFAGNGRQLEITVIFLIVNVKDRFELQIEMARERRLE